MSAATSTFSHGICAYRISYDSTKINGSKLKAIFDYLAAGSLAAPPPSVTTVEELAALDVSAYRKACAARLAKLRSLRFVDGAAVEATRDRQVAALEAVCTRGSAAMDGAKGDVNPMGDAAPTSARYADLLASTTTGLKAQWNCA